MEKDYLLWRRRGRDFTLEPESTALVIIDMQYANASRSEGEGKLAKQRGEEASADYRFSTVENIVIPNIIKLLAFFRENKLRIIYVTLGSEMPDYSDTMPYERETRSSRGNTKGNREHEILDEIKPLPGECVVNKLTSGAFNSSNIDFILRAMGIKYMLFTGASTSACVEGTFRDAVDLGYCCLAVEDACGDWTVERHNDGIARFRKMGRVETTDGIIKELYAVLSKPHRNQNEVGS